MPTVKPNLQTLKKIVFFLSANLSPTTAFLKSLLKLMLRSNLLVFGTLANFFRTKESIYLVVDICKQHFGAVVRNGRCDLLLSQNWRQLRKKMAEEFAKNITVSTIQFLLERKPDSNLFYTFFSLYSIYRELFTQNQVIRHKSTKYLCDDNSKDRLKSQFLMSVAKKHFYLNGTWFAPFSEKIRKEALFTLERNCIKTFCNELCLNSTHKTIQFGRQVTFGSTTMFYIIHRHTSSKSMSCTFLLQLLALRARIYVLL